MVESMRDAFGTEESYEHDPKSKVKLSVEVAPSSVDG